MALASGIGIVSNQVCYSLLDRRPGGAMATLCGERGAGIAGPPLPYLALGAALPGGHTCPDLGESVPTGMQLLEAQTVMTFNDGSMIWGNSPPDGYVCFTTGYGYAPYDIVGGSGRFEGATGWIVIELQTYDYGPDVFPPFFVTPETGIAKGEILDASGTTEPGTGGNFFYCNSAVEKTKKGWYDYTDK